VYIGTPHVFHLQNALDAIAAGKHVLCEKPMTMNARDTQVLVEAARKKGVYLMEGTKTLKSHPSHSSHTIQIQFCNQAMIDLTFFCYRSLDALQSACSCSAKAAP